MDVVFRVAVSHALALPYPTTDDDVEIWDYKSGALPDKKTETGRRELADYEFQMHAVVWSAARGTSRPARCWRS